MFIIVTIKSESFPVCEDVRTIFFMICNRSNTTEVTEFTSHPVLNTKAQMNCLVCAVTSMTKTKTTT